MSLQQFSAKDIIIILCGPVLEVCTNRIFQAQARPDPIIFFSDFGPVRLGFSDFKTDPFSLLHIINAYFF